MKQLLNSFIFISFFILISFKSWSCDDTNTLVTSVIDNGNGTFTVTVNLCVEPDDFTGTTEYEMFQFAGANIISVSPASISFSDGITHTPGPISGGTVTYSGGFVSTSIDQACFTFTFITSAKPTSLYTENGHSSCTHTAVIPTFVNLTCTATGGTFTDPGGAGNYGNNVNQVTTICPDGPGGTVTVTFPAGTGVVNTDGSFSQCNADNLYIYNGNQALPANLLGTYCEFSPSPGTVNSTDPSGCITFQFVSDGSTVKSGWNATVTCGGCTSPTLTITNQTNPTCAGNNGSFTINASGGSGSGYTYSIYNGTTFTSTSNPTGLAAGTYQVIVKDNSGCQSAPTTVTLTASSSPTLTVSNQTNPSCASNNGSFTINASGGSGSGYTYSIDNGVTYTSTANPSALAAGSYQVIVKDGNGCISAVTTVNLVSASAPALTISNQTNPPCNTTNGSFTITASGGSGSGYTYSINNGTTYTAVNNPTGLAAGTYQVIVKDGAGCVSATTTVTLTTPSAVNPVYTTDSTNVTCNGANNGTITINGTSTGITYSWVSGPIVSPIPAANLPAGATDEKALINLPPGTYCVDIGGPAPGTTTTTILTETFEDNGANWTIDNSTGANIFVVNNNYPGGSCVTGAGTFTVPTVPNQPAGVTAGPTSKYLHIKATTTTGVTCGAGSSSPFPPLNANFDGATSDQKATLNTVVNTTGYSNVTVTFYWLGKGDASGNDYGVLEYSLNNGATWTQNGGKLFNQTTWKLETMTNPAWNNVASIKFRFRWRNNASSSTDPPLAVDQFVVKGDITNPCTNTIRECFTITEPAAVAAPTVTNDTICQGDASVNFQASGTGTLNWYTAASGGTSSSTTPTQVSTSAGTYTYYVSQTIGGCQGPRVPVNVVVNPRVKPIVLLTGTTASTASFNWAAVSGATSYGISYYINNGAVQTDNTTNNSYAVNGLADGDSVTIIVNPIGSSSICYVSDTAYTVLPSIACGSCNNATCPIAGPYTSYNDADNNSNHCSQINVLGTAFTNGTYISYHTVTASSTGELGVVISIGFNTAGGPCNETKGAVLYPVGNCTSPVNPTSINPNGGTKYNPEWTGLTPNATYVLLITIDIPAGCDMLDHCESFYHPPVPQLCGSCATPNCPIGNVPTFEDRSYDTCNTNINITGPETYSQYHLVTADAGGMIGVAQLVQSVGTVTRSAYLLPVGNCGASPILPSDNWVHSDVVGSGFNPEWYGLTPGAQYVLVIDFVIPAGVTLEYTCADYYGIPMYCGTPGITANSTSFNCTDTAIALTAFEPNLANGFSVPAVTLEIFDVNATGNNITLGIMEGSNIAGTIPVNFAGNQYYAADLFWWDPTDPVGLSIDDPTGGSDYFYRIIEYGTGKVLAWGHAVFTGPNTLSFPNLCTTSGIVTWSVDGVPYGTGIMDGVNHASGEAILNPSLLSLGTHTITYSWNNGISGINACSGTTDLVITVSGSVAQPSIGGNNLVCINDSNLIYSVQYNNGSTYTWTVTSGVTILSGQGTNSITVNWGTNSGQLYCIESNNCGVSPQDTFIVNVQTIVPLSSIVGTLSVCPFTSNLNYTVNNPNPGSTFSWSINGGTIVSGNGTSSVVVDWGDVGTATLIVIENTVCGTQGPDTLTCIISNPPVSPLISFPDDTICSFTSNQVYSVINNPTSNYLWTVPVGSTIINGQGTNQITVNWGNQTTSGLVTVTEVSICGNGALAMQPVTVLPLPTDPLITGSDSVCPGQNNVSYTVNNIYGSTYQWTVTGGTIISGDSTNSVMVHWNSNGPGTVTVNQTNLCGITNPNSVNVLIHSINVGLPSVVQICPGESSVLNVIGTASQYSWIPSASLNNPLLNNPTASPLSTTIYTAISNDGCQISDTVTVIVKPLPEPKFTTSNPENEIYSLVQLVNETDPFTSLNWNIEDSVIMDITNPTFVSYDTGWVSITQIAELNGCYDTLIKKIYIKDTKTIYIPNAFTPNEDLDNEKFKVVVNGYEKIDVYIYDRWGVLIKDWHTFNDGWDGKYKNKDAPIDVYAYKVVLYDTLNSPSTKTIHGTVNLIR